MTEDQIVLAQAVLEAAVRQSPDNFITGSLRDVGVIATLPLAHIGAGDDQAVAFALDVAHMAAGAASEIHHEINGNVVTAEDLGDDISIRIGGIEALLIEMDGSDVVDVDYDPAAVESIIDGLRLAKAA